jgi:hypothetical protein
MERALLAFGIACVVVFGAAALFYPAMRLGRRGRTAAWMVLSAVIAAAPCLPPVEMPYLRFLVSLAAFGCLLKLYDLYKHPAGGSGMSFAAYLAYLPNWFWFVRRRIPQGRPRERDLRQLAGALALTAAGVAGVLFLFRLDWSRVPFAVEHCVKVMAVFLVAVQVARATSAAFRLLGAGALDTTSNPFAARTPADFWRRWNRATRDWLDEYAFKAAGGFAHPVRATLAAFAVSGLVHEYVFGIAAWRVQGWQALFFMVQGLAAVMTLRVRPRGLAAVFWTAGTLAFTLLTALIFFKSVDMVLPFYWKR